MARYGTELTLARIDSAYRKVLSPWGRRSFLLETMTPVRGEGAKIRVEEVPVL
jgi:hypothetical protein